MKIYKTKYFHRWAMKVKLSNEVLTVAMEEVRHGLIEANLGGNLYKKRISLSNKGKSGGFRTLLAYKKEEISIFVFGFEKNQKDNIDTFEEEALKKLAKTLLKMSKRELSLAVDYGELIEVV